MASLFVALFVLAVVYLVWPRPFTTKQTILICITGTTLACVYMAWVILS